MICTVIQNKTFDEIQKILEHCEMAEIRLDRCPLSEQEIRICFSSDVPLAATCRVSEVMSADRSLNEIAASMVCEKRLVAAIEAGAKYVDIELEAPRSMSKRVRKAAMENGTVFIRSYHNFEGTDSMQALVSVADRCVREGAQIVKIVTMATCAADVNRVMSLYDDADPGTLIAFCMGDEGRESRIDCLRKGAPYTYASLSGGEPAAPGQIPADEMSAEVYGGFRFIDGDTVRMPSSKSFAQRAIIAAALAGGKSRLTGYTPCGDNVSALKVAEALGARVAVHGDCLEIEGIAAVPGCLNLSAIDVGESGLLARIAFPLSAVLSDAAVTVTGSGSLTGRPMSGVREMLEKFSVSVSGTGGNTVSDCMAGEPLAVPVTVKGPLKACRPEISGVHGSQTISGLLMSLPLLEKNSGLTVHDPKSIPYMYMTLDVMKKFGVRVSSEMLGGQDFVESGGDWAYCTDIEFRIRGAQRYRPAEFSIEGDWSTAANFLVAGAVFGRLKLSGLDTTSVQADLSIMDILMDAGASLSQTDGDRGEITVQRAPLNAFDADLNNCPDLFPIAAVLAAFCQGRSSIRGTGRLVHKESDRAAAILEMLEKMGVASWAEDDVLYVEGQSLAMRILTGSLLRGGDYSSHHDHRMAMALAVAGLGADSPVSIDDRECVAKSFPAFFEVFGFNDRF